MLGQLVDNDCKHYLDKIRLIVGKDNELSLQGYRSIDHRLWDIPIYSHPNPKIKIQEANYRIPKVHILHSVTNQPSTVSRLLPDTHHDKNKTILPTFLQNMDKIVNLNECGTLIDK